MEPAGKGGQVNGHLPHPLGGSGMACGEMPPNALVSPFFPASSSWCQWHVGSSHRYGISYSFLPLFYQMSCPYSPCPACCPEGEREGKEGQHLSRDKCLSA